MVFQLVLIITGFALLIYGANWLVDGASSLAKKHNVSDLAIGLTVVAFGTSAPEMVVNIIASWKGFSDIVLGNILGSNNFNLFIILGISGLIWPIAIKSSTAWKEIPISVGITILLLFLINDFFIAQFGMLGRMEGIIMLGLFFLFLFYVFSQIKNDSVIITEAGKISTRKTWFLIIFGLIGLVSGGQFVVLNSVKIANELGISEKIIGLTIVAAGTSLPELLTSIVAAAKKNSDIAIGNVIGSNIFNILLILSVSSIIKPIEFNPMFNVDLYVLMGGTIFLLISMLTGQRKKLDRWEAGILLVFYLLYTLYLIVQEI